MAAHRVRAVFVHANPRGDFAGEVAAGRAPDTGLLGQNHLGELGIDATLHDPLLSRGALAWLPFRLRWHLRELTVPWEVGDADLICTPLATFLPLSARLRRRRVLVVNYGLCARFARAGAAQRALLTASLRSAASVVCFAAAQREQLVEQAGLRPERVHVALYGVDERFYASAPLPDDGYVLAVGRDLARDYSTFATAARGLGVRSIVVASERNLVGVERPSDLEVRIDVDHAELRELYAGAGCVVVPTRREDFPFGADCSGHTVLLEAMAIARPVVVSSRSTNAEYVAGEGALEVPPEDPPALRAAIERVLSDRELASRMAHAARSAVEDRFTTRHLAERLAPLIEAASGRV